MQQETAGQELQPLLLGSQLDACGLKELTQGGGSPSSFVLSFQEGQPSRAEPRETVLTASVPKLEQLVSSPQQPTKGYQTQPSPPAYTFRWSLKIPPQGTHQHHQHKGGTQMTREGDGPNPRSRGDLAQPQI